MSDLEGGKRLQPRMGRGSWRLSIWSAGLMVLAFSPLAITKFGGQSGSDVGAAWVFSLAILVGAVRFVYLLRIHRNDAPFWNEEEARRAEWDRRGRQL
jgi:hypothetical protein